MKKKFLFSFIVVSVLFSGCAQKADSIKATYVSPLTYSGKSCTQLRNEVIRINNRLMVISGQQDKTANKDMVVGVVGAVVFWPALFLLAAGEDQKAEIANLKGQYEAIEKVARQKGCRFIAKQENKSK